jgi:DNA-directed RNA polymerase subunit K/omega
MKEDKYIPLEQLLGATNGSIYKLAVLAAKRALELADGAKSLIEKPGEKYLENALAEIVAQKVGMAESNGAEK